MRWWRFSKPRCARRRYRSRLCPAAANPTATATTTRSPIRSAGAPARSASPRLRERAAVAPSRPPRARSARRRLGPRLNRILQVVAVLVPASPSCPLGTPRLLRNRTVAHKWAVKQRSNSTNSVRPRGSRSARSRGRRDVGRLDGRWSPGPSPQPVVPRPFRSAKAVAAAFAAERARAYPITRGSVPPLGRTRRATLISFTGDVADGQVGSLRGSFPGGRRACDDPAGVPRGRGTVGHRRMRLHVDRPRGLAHTRV